MKLLLIVIGLLSLTQITQADSVKLTLPKDEFGWEYTVSMHYVDEIPCISFEGKNENSTRSISNINSKSSKVTADYFENAWRTLSSLTPPKKITVSKEVPIPKGCRHRANIFIKEDGSKTMTINGNAISNSELKSLVKVIRQTPDLIRKAESAKGK